MSLKDERDYFLKRTIELEEVLKTGALEAVQRGRMLVQTLPSREASRDLEDLATKIRQIVSLELNPSDDRRSAISRYRAARVGQNKLTPEKAFRMALKSLASSIDYFENEQDLAQVKSDSVERERDVLDKTIKSLKDQLKEANSNCEEWKSKYDSHSAELSMLEDIAEQMEFFETDRDRLAAENLTLQAKIVQLKSSANSKGGIGKLETVNATLRKELEKVQSAFRQVEKRNRSLQSELQMLQSADKKGQPNDDYDMDAVIVDMQNTVSELEAENAALHEKLDQQQESMDKLERESQCKRFDAMFEDKANDFKLDELRARVNDLGQENTSLREQCTDLENIVAKLEATKADMELQILRLKESNASLEDSASAATSRLTEKENANGLELSRTESREEKFSFTRRHLPRKSLLSPRGTNELTMPEMVAKLNELEDEQARLNAKCTTQQMRISILEDELEKVTAETISQDAQITMLRNATSCDTTSTSSDHSPLTKWEDNDEVATLSPTSSSSLSKTL